MSKLISTLEQLHLLRARAVDDLSSQLASQNQRCQRFEKNIDALSALAAGLGSQSGSSAAMMINQSKYKHNIQRIIDWQKQEQALANLEAQKLQGNLLAEAKREKSLELVLDARRADRQADLSRREQKLTDAVSAQCWLRQQRQARQR
ncbi:flagellar export protein FliJ [Intestinirhabdus alba]|jgi:flagellar export protein FliJ|uniref:Flagellar FliJ protein n=1 Tax=Intestinirhabdus alba TaxID=2899544 RepID=A0A6L6IH58_9ENTR|nr:flagellar export protein FliJ [Intestinirhabdus alba]MTH46151.1 flagellar export protein FliJ [Intestinirhabdus alba]